MRMAVNVRLGEMGGLHDMCDLVAFLGKLLESKTRERTSDSKLISSGWRHFSSSVTSYPDTGESLK